MALLAEALAALGVPMRSDPDTRHAVRKPLEGRDPLSRTVADALNLVASGPGRSTGFDYRGAQVDLRRGAGQTVSGSVGHAAIGRVTAAGQIATPADRKEVSFSGLRLSGDRARFGASPSGLRVFNTSQGELRYEFQPYLDVSFPSPIPGVPLRVRTRPGEQYVIGKSVTR